MFKKGWEKYATQNRLKQKGYFRKHQNRNACGETPKASGSDSYEQSRQEPKEEIEVLEIIEILEEKITEKPKKQKKIKVEKNPKQT